MNNIYGQEFLRELEAEVSASRKCLERIPESLWDYKPHEKSMVMKNLVFVVAEIPKWISSMLEIGEINFSTWPKYNPANAGQVLVDFDTNVENAKKALANTTDEKMKEIFYLKFGDKVLMQYPMKESISSTLNHLVHHRGQLTVYMRLNNIPVPKIYGPSADEPTF